MQSACRCGKATRQGRTRRRWRPTSSYQRGPSVICLTNSVLAAGLSPPQCRGNPGSDFPDDLLQRALDYRREHPDWGAPLIRVMLSRLNRWVCVPSTRTLQRWLENAALAPAPPGRKAPYRPRSSVPHERWQSDAADQLRLGNGQLASWLRLIDECSGAILKTIVFDCVFNRVPPQAVRAGMREAFAQWGMPLILRLDNGWPWGGWFDLPTPLAMDLVGLGLQLQYNDPRCPRQNGVVERSHQTSQGWVEPHTCVDAADLQRRSDEMDEIHRREYPHRGAKSRLEMYPELAHSGREYSQEWEENHWDMRKVKEYLANHVATRRVSETGQVTVYDRRYSVGRVNKGKTAVVQYDSTSNEWLFSSEQGVLWCRYPAEQVTAERVRALSLSANATRSPAKT